MDEEELSGREKTLKRFATLTLLFVVVAVIATVIDHGIKKQILDEAARARATLDEIKRVAAEVKNRGTQETGEAGGAADAGVDSGGDVVHDPGPRPGADQDAVDGALAAVERAFGVEGGPPGDG